MSKIIKITPDVFDSIVEDFRNTLGNLKMSEGKISFNRSFDKVERTAELRFTEIAWLKMQALVREYDKEVAWHGIAKRGTNPDKDEYIISDIVVYPQEVSGATVTTDQEEYQNWLFQLDDEVFNNLRMQGHSHVNMGVSPSAVDTTLYESLLAQLDDTMFYIFLIWNKRGDKMVKIYDLAKNILFETADVKVSIIDDGSGVEALLRDAKAKVKERTYSYSSSTSYGGSGVTGYGSNYGAYKGGYNGSYGNYTPPNSNTAPKEPTKTSQSLGFTTQPEKPKTTAVIDVSAERSKKRKGKRKKDKGYKTPSISAQEYEDILLDGFDI